MRTWIRLDKYLCACTGCTRSQSKLYLKKGLVKVNGEPEKRPEIKVDPGKDQVSLEGRVLSYREHEYLMFHKPAGCVTAVSDREHKTVMITFREKTKEGFSQWAVLDLDTEGLLFLTDDGELAHRLLAPGRHVERNVFRNACSPCFPGGCGCVSDRNRDWGKAPYPACGTVSAGNSGTCACHCCGRKVPSD